MTRTVRHTNIKSGAFKDVGERPFTDFVDASGLVLLGDPGAGKTHVFSEAAKADGGKFLKARAFLSTPAARLKGQSVWIDGLDEQRAGRSDRAIIDELVAKLFEVDPSKVRISCRVADWLGESDLAGLRPFLEQHGETVVLLLQNLSRPEQLAVLAAQGAGQAEADAFLNEATQRGLSDFLENPQNLIMLWRAVNAGNWPETRKGLFDVSTTLLLKEFDEERARSGSGMFTAAELRPVAGAVCAARLISDVIAISLKEQEGTGDIPGYRSLSFYPPEQVVAALSRRIFDAGPEAETVDYSHRTTAEFVAAEFLAQRVRDGLPIGRVRVLLGVDGHPASELRGLHAWLAVHLPEHADALIEADPYGVLTYGDAAALSPSSCACLVRALDRLSEENPWFRSGNLEARSIGGLARPDMALEFRAILNNPASGFGVRSVVIDALMLGSVIPELLPDLKVAFARQTSPFAERSHALAALLRYGPDGEKAVQEVFANLGTTVNDVRLRAEVIRLLYGYPYGAADIVKLLNDSMTGDEATGSGLFWRLADTVPVQDLPAVLDGIVPPEPNGKRFDRRGWEASSFYARLLVRAWRANASDDPARIINWLRKRVMFKGGNNESRARDLRTAMREGSQKLPPLARHFLRIFPVDKDAWSSWQRFREALLFELDSDALLDIAHEEMVAAAKGSDRREFLYHLSFSLCYQATEPHASQVFGAIYNLAETDPALAELRNKATVSHFGNNYFEGRTSHEEIDVGESREQQRQQFDREVEQIRSGQHVGWLIHLMRFYFGFYDEAGEAAAPRARLAAWIGEERVKAALEGFAASLTRDDLPGFAKVMELTAERQHMDWWYVLSEGLNQRVSSGHGLSGLSDDFLKGMLVFEVANPVSEERDGSSHWVVQRWRTELMARRPDFVRDAYMALAQLHLGGKGQSAEGLSELLTDDAFAATRVDTVLELLKANPNANQFDLAKMLNASAKLPRAHDRLMALCRKAIGNNAIGERQRDLWLATGFRLSPTAFEDDVRRRANGHPQFVFEIRDHGRDFGDDGPQAMRLLPELEFLVALAGRLFPDAAFPSGVRDGDRNAWDAAGWIRNLISTIAAMPSASATEALERFKADGALASYKPHILYALASQRQLRRDAEYDRLDWPQTVAAFDNGPPSTVADLHALVVAHLRDLAFRIGRANTDIFKQFWNLDSYSRPTVPRPEEACRDDVVTLMRPSLLSLGVTVEPEGHMIADKRADIAVAMPSRKILCELKRDYHDEVWTAIEGQLERFYAHDPEAKGFGVFCVFWFGDKRPSSIPVPPNGLSRPHSAAEMEKMLTDQMPRDWGQRLAVVVIDVSGNV